MPHCVWRRIQIEPFPLNIKMSWHLVIPVTVRWNFYLEMQLLRLHSRKNPKFMVMSFCVGWIKIIPQHTAGLLSEWFNSSGCNVLLNGKPARGGRSLMWKDTAAGSAFRSLYKNVIISFVKGVLEEKLCSPCTWAVMSLEELIRLERCFVPFSHSFRGFYS